MAIRSVNATAVPCDVDFCSAPFSVDDRFRLTTDGHSALAAYEKSPLCLVQYEPCGVGFVWGEEVES